MYTWTKNQKGTTLIELILYVTIVSIMISALIPYAWSTMQAGIKNGAQREVNANARYINDRIKYEIRNALGINSVSATSISLIKASPNNPTVIDLSGTNIRITQGVGTPQNLNSSDVTVSGLTFTNYTSSDNKTKHIGYTFTVSDNGASAAYQYQGSIITRSSAEVRNN